MKKPTNRLSAVPFYLFFLATTLILCSCSVFVSDEEANQTTTTLPIATNIKSIELYLAHNSYLQSPEYELFKLSSGKLYIECGIIRNSKQYAQTRTLRNPSQAQINSILESSQEVIDNTSDKSNLSEEPGDLSGLIDPGQLYLTIQETHTESTKEPIVHQIRTSTNAIASGSGVPIKKIQKLVHAIREVALEITGSSTNNGDIAKSKQAMTTSNSTENGEPTRMLGLCGNIDFYGLP